MALLRSLAALVLFLPAVLPAQNTPGGNDSVFTRAQRLVAEGRGEEGRALVERTLSSAPAGSAEYAAALYWRGVMAPTAAEAERDLRRVIVEFSLSAYADDALLRLAQLEIARGDRVRATEHLERLLSDHPNSDVRPRAQLTMARMQLDAGQLSPGCARLRAAASSAPATDIELRNQITFMQQRCAGVPTDARVAETRTAHGEVPAPPRSRGPARQASGPVDTAGAPAPASASSGAPSSGDRAAAASRPAAPRTPPVGRTASGAGRPSSATSSGGAAFSVQVGAFSSRAQADRIVKDLVTRGYTARVVPGPRNLYRVRVGRYASRERAGAALTTMKQGGVDGMVVEAEPR